ncbi:MAG: endopeptidase La [Chloroherpetonaceae bacterium]|nr:endopeptidase La [Chthonomonadaceae bacterium]MDW8209233.1 endopeptidase La [Chloroherpetonaceae bacterium]
MPRTPRKAKGDTGEGPAGKRRSRRLLEEIARQELTALESPELENNEGAEDALPTVLPLLPIRDQVYFPHMIFPLLVGREKSVRALEEATAGNRYILLVAQKNLQAEDPEPEDIYSIGIIAEIMQVLRVPDGTVRVMLEGLERCEILHYLQTEPYFRVAVRILRTEEKKDLLIEALMRSVVAQFEQVVNASKNIQPEALINVVNTDDPGRLADVITPYLRQMRVDAQQEILETLDVKERLHRLSLVLKKEAEILDIQKSIRSRVEKEMGETQKEFLLREQLKIIQQELGERDERSSEIEEYRARIAAAGMPEAAAERANRELDRLEKMPFATPEGVVIRNYLDWLVSLPWSAATPDDIDLEKAAAMLDADHYGLEKTKERILEFLAVRRLTGTTRGPILCFVGPPGVGKTSIGRSIAAALNRKFIRVSLGGVRDEAEIRGHRRTYIGAMPGRIIQGIKQAGARNPVFMLDEIDKLGMDFRGDPSSALLEALDPEQNREFSDHYLEVPFDLSDVMFVTTANLLDPIPPALRDRMEVIPFTGYTEEDKLAIACRFLVPKQRRDHGLSEQHLNITDEALRHLIRQYTREAGVRNLEREIAAICRKIARQVVAGETGTVTVDAEDLPVFLGQPRYRYGLVEERDEIAAATGLVYTEAGGDIVTIEVSLLRGHEGRVQLTGHLGDVMKESAQTALSFIRSRAATLGVDEEFHRHLDVHVHVPAGSVPKDGPSAGITIAAAIASALTRRPVRKDVAMTGEITLRGRVLPVGGVREKVLAAHRAGIRTVLIPADNEKDLEELPDYVRRDLCFRLVQHMDEVLEIALLPSESAGALAISGPHRSERL